MRTPQERNGTGPADGDTAVPPLAAGASARLRAQKVSGGTGMGAILGQLLAAVDDHGAECAPRELDRLGRVTLDLVDACLEERRDTHGESPAAASRPGGLMERINTYIDHNLGDPDLTPQTIAARHHISVRRLHLMFQDEQDSVAAAVRRRRLERCHADLVRPDLLTRPVHAIAARWGFGSAAVFGRAFREAYGLSPGERRAQAAAADRPHPGTP
ncbi:helix-turn-helix domain-containing protein [Streptomyces sp. NPDC054932]